jgi:glycosyltransferase involved in cell wall biosynthesis
MFDDCHNIPDHLFRKYMDFRWIAFSQTLHKRFVSMGLRSAQFRYFPTVTGHDISINNNESAGLRGFFWQRNNDITWHHIKKLIGDTAFTGFHLHLAIDPLWYKEVMPDDDDIRRYKITISRWFDKKEEYLHALSGAHVFFAPRLFEGIGMPFLEAMALGKVVVAPDHPTMNEYIIDGENGLLYNPAKVRPADFNAVGQIMACTKVKASQYHENWIRQTDELRQWIVNENQQTV